MKDMGSIDFCFFFVGLTASSSIQFTLLSNFSKRAQSFRYRYRFSLIFHFLYRFCCCCCLYLLLPGGPATFVLCWAIIKAFAIEPQKLSADGVSLIYRNFKLYSHLVFCFSLKNGQIYS